MGELTRHEVDIAIAPLTISNERKKAVQFTKPFLESSLNVLIRKPQKKEVNLVFKKLNF